MVYSHIRKPILLSYTAAHYFSEVPAEEVERDARKGRTGRARIGILNHLDLGRYRRCAPRQDLEERLGGDDSRDRHSVEEATGLEEMLKDEITLDHDLTVPVLWTTVFADECR
ncbi:hypothetical protein CC1G_15091 [Coprinopsis cinerea okayama7|uniref:Uncharacterized protein n=1 Tax=Coprinopsis cinerea (strain Okayama-7 / 130 / ATCC MYA-4618 / FGSC 9003) TaxID=240176 RepID=D6RPF8_COPC7|nr:hypothetical protein CC1G_15091 [Coprinopsis cinerea okayama7\|eukprot:XP_002910757.1 hypothetical protein CC1G_15091 [Coprinopsis cinerea okayama7\